MGFVREGTEFQEITIKTNHVFSDVFFFFFFFFFFLNILLRSYPIRVMRKPDACLCENNGTDQLCSNCTADQRLCFCFTKRTILLFLKHEIFVSFYNHPFWMLRSVHYENMPM